MVYPFFEGIAWNQHFGVQAWLKAAFAEEFHDFAGSVVVHAVGGWVALPAVLLLGARRGRYSRDGAIASHPPSNIPFLALGAWIFDGRLVRLQCHERADARQDERPSRDNSLIAMVGGTLVAVLLGKNDPGFAYNGPLADGAIIYGALKKAVGIRLDPEQEFDGAYLSIHKITSPPERETSW